MRELLFDLSADSYLHQSDFAGFEGEHNATRITLNLPHRLQVEGAEFYMVFEILKRKETVFSAPLFLQDGAVSLILPRQLMSSPGTSVYVAAYRREGENLQTIAKTGKVFLEIKEPEEGNPVEYSTEGGGIPGLVVEDEILPNSKSPISSGAVWKALEKTVSEEDLKRDFSKVDTEISALKTEDENLKKEIADLEISQENFSKETVTLKGEISKVKEENILLAEKTEALSEKIDRQKKEILTSFLIGKEKGESGIRMNDVAATEEEIQVQLSGGEDFVKIYQNGNSEICETGYYTVTGIRSPDLGDGMWEFTTNDGSYLIYPAEEDVFAEASLVKVGDVIFHDVETGNGYLYSSITDYSTVPLTMFGKNFVNIENPTYKLNAVYEVDGDGGVTLTRGDLASGGEQSYTSRAYWNLGRYDDFVGKTFTVSLNVLEKSVSTNDSLSVYANFNGKNATRISSTLNFNSTGEKVLSFTVPENTKEWENIGLFFNYQSLGTTTETGEYIKFKELQVEWGDKATEYEGYKEPVSFIPDADGVVAGITGYYPTVTFMVKNEDVKIEAVYCRDINRVIEQIENAIVALGGNV